MADLTQGQQELLDIMRRRGGRQNPYRSAIELHRMASHIDTETVAAQLAYLGLAEFNESASGIRLTAAGLQALSGDPQVK